MSHAKPNKNRKLSAVQLAAVNAAVHICFRTCTNQVICQARASVLHNASAKPRQIKTSRDGEQHPLLQCTGILCLSLQLQSLTLAAHYRGPVLLAVMECHANVLVAAGSTFKQWACSSTPLL